jgi:hypothetical protein
VDWLGIGIRGTAAVGATVQSITGTGFALVCAPFLLLMLGHDVGLIAGSLGALPIPALAVQWTMVAVAALGGVWLTVTGTGEVLATAADISAAPCGPKTIVELFL